ncbi:hypothetical protein ACYE2N_07375 [Flavobacterium sp. MAHUQ-51]|uniref:hypothetical protein n=1 Tax=Flavobacterium sp. GCM10022190 TaxID=3252639 RepID=UPI00361479B9
MNAKGKKSKIDQVEEEITSYERIITKQKGIDPETFDFDAEFKKGYTPEEFKEEMLKRIKAYPWKK